MKKNRVSLLILLAGFLHIGASEAKLIDRGGGLIYDDVLNVTWMQDAQYSITSGYSSSGRLSWTDANAFAAGVEYYDSVRGVVWDDWRLPTTINLSTSSGYDVTGLSSELAYMYYINLEFQPNYTPSPSDPAPFSTAYNPFVNIAYRGYWSQTLSDFSNRAWYLHMHFGFQSIDGIGEEQRVWLLRDGDVAPAVPVPEPGTLALFGMGLVAARAVRRRQQARAS